MNWWVADGWWRNYGHLCIAYGNPALFASPKSHIHPEIWGGACWGRGPQGPQTPHPRITLVGSFVALRDDDSRVSWAVDQRLKQHHCNRWTLEKVHHIYSPLDIFWTFSFEKALPNPLNPLSHCFEVRARTRSCSVGHKPSPLTKVLNVFCCPVRFPAIGVYAFKRAQSAMQQPLLEEAQTVV